MSESIKSVARNTEISRAVSLAIATALVGFASSANAQNASSIDTETPAGAESIEEVVVTGFRASLECRADRQARVGRRDRFDPLGRHRQVPGLEPRRVHAARPRRVHHARRGRRPQHLGARPRLSVHARAHQRHGSDEHHRRHGQLGRHQPQPAVRLQRVRIGAVQQPHRAQDRVGRCRRRFAGRNRRPADRASVRLQGIHHGRGPQGRLQRPAGGRGATCHFPRQQHFRRRPLRCAVLGGIRRAQPARGRPEHGALGSWLEQRWIQRRFGDPRRHHGAVEQFIPCAHSSLWPPHA